MCGIQEVCMFPARRTLRVVLMNETKDAYENHKLRTNKQS